MQVMRWNKFETLGRIPRSDEAQLAGLMEDADDSAGVTCIFISHSWWERSKETAAPDFTSGELAHLKYKVICGGVRALITREGLDASRVALWCDYFSIDQVDDARKAQGVRSMAHYTTACDLMLIPVATPHVVSEEYAAAAAGTAAPAEECMAYYPEEVADYGARGWYVVARCSNSEPLLCSRVADALDSAAEGLQSTTEMLDSATDMLTVLLRCSHVPPFVGRRLAAGAGSSSSSLG